MAVGLVGIASMAEFCTRKKKCDGRQPICSLCEARGVECKGFGVKLVWEDEVRRQGMSRRGPRIWRKQPRDTSIFAQTDTTIETITLQAARWAQFKDLLGLQTAHLSKTDSPTCIRPPLSPFPHSLSPVQSLLFCHYVAHFVPTYFSCRDPDMPFLSMMIPLAMRNSTILSALIALSAIQAGRDGSIEIKIEMLRAKKATLNGCKRLLAVLNGEDTVQVPFASFQRDTENLPANAEKKIQLCHEDLLILFASVLLLMLYEQVTDATYSTIRPHIAFAHWLSNMLESAGSTMPGELYRHYEFLREILFYDDLVASISARRSPMVKYHKHISISQLTFSSDELGKQYLPMILSRITSRDPSVMLEDLDRWDGRMDWLPSFFVHTERNSFRQESPAFDKEILDISKLYRTVSKIFFYQMSCKGRCIDAQSLRAFAKPHLCPTKGTSLDSNVTSSPIKMALARLTLDAISLLRELPKESQYQGALLWPIGIVSREVESEDLATQAYILKLLENLEHRYGMRHFGRYKASLALIWSGRNSAGFNSCEVVDQIGTFSIDMDGEILLS